MRALIEAVEAAGIPADEFRRVTGISFEQLESSYGWIEVAEIERLIRRAMELTGDDAFGLHWIDARR